MSQAKIFDVIDALIADLPLTPEKVAKALDTRIVRDSDSDTAAIEAYAQPASAKSGPYQTVDLRMPDADIGDGAVFLSVTVRDHDGVDQAAVCEKFGTDFQAETPSPRYAPGTVPVYLTFQREWGTLAFGVSADEARTLIRFIVTAKAD